MKGSGRSIAGLHLRDALDLVSKRHPHLIQKFGGHAMAAGLSIREEHLNDFRQAFEVIAQELLDAESLVKTIATDGPLETREFTLSIARDLQHQVWGQGFPEPLFEGDFQVQTQRVVGEKHLKLKLSSPAGSFDAIRFFSAEPAPDTIHEAWIRIDFLHDRGGSKSTGDGEGVRRSCQARTGWLNLRASQNICGAKMAWSPPSA